MGQVKTHFCQNNGASKRRVKSEWDLDTGRTNGHKNTQKREITEAVKAGPHNEILIKSELRLALC